ncbi:MAG TPA: GDSL-type esterase/lipase family protein [Thermodesulfovibrionia bacterium]|nr:GDSL-type esterase/lipase family protein [Thermodesulfovibrionia bacterium]
MDKLFIITFGDSLTVGYQSPTFLNPWYGETPYADFLNKKMTADGQSVRFLVKGISGELTSDMVSRFHRDVIEHKPDYVVILGGTNDQGWDVPLDEIIKNLTNMYEKALSNAIKPVGVTIPSIRDFDFLIRQRIDLNNQIKSVCNSLNIPCVDLFTASSEPETFRLAQEYSNDGLHLTTEGYSLLADLLYDKVFNKV